jgi:hypothetical protein
MKPAFVSLGMTAMHLACVSNEDGIWLDDVMFCTTCAAASVLSPRQRLKQLRVNTATNTAIEPSFLITDLLSAD